MKRTIKNLCKYFCRKCNNFIFYNEACELIYAKVYPQYSRVYYDKNAFDKHSGNSNVSGIGSTSEQGLIKSYDNLYRQIYRSGLCGVNKQRNDLLNKDNIQNILLYLNKGGIKCTKCRTVNMWYMKNV
ncbi:conserved Plasmodium protein, unknown function [Plasmodium malariae]|uniref:Uncharacterized protein n=1 Tax=Plasmodium malariae TaxID=5858 RepID=A0A1C3KCC9_PLAMA|nr:conserved Plasmodium protein, unknown function [Plasmodium malariae]